MAATDDTAGEVEAAVAVTAERFLLRPAAELAALPPDAATTGVATTGVIMIGIGIGTIAGAITMGAIWTTGVAEAAEAAAAPADLFLLPAALAALPLSPPLLDDAAEAWRRRRKANAETAGPATEPPNTCRFPRPLEPLPKTGAMKASGSFL